jgi:hypothetical protein
MSPICSSRGRRLEVKNLFLRHHFNIVLRRTPQHPATGLARGGQGNRFSYRRIESTRPAWRPCAAFIVPVSRLRFRQHREKRLARMSKSRRMPTKSWVWLEAECLRLARQVCNGSQIQHIMIRRLRAKGTVPNWKVADIIPQPSLKLSTEIRAALAHLPDTYFLEGDN